MNKVTSKGQQLLIKIHKTGYFLYNISLFNHLNIIATILYSITIFWSMFILCWELEMNEACVYFHFKHLYSWGNAKEYDGVRFSELKTD